MNPSIENDETAKIVKEFTGHVQAWLLTGGPFHSPLLPEENIYSGVIPGLFLSQHRDVRVCPFCLQGDRTNDGLQSDRWYSHLDCFTKYAPCEICQCPPDLDEHNWPGSDLTIGPVFRSHFKCRHPPTH